MRASAALAWRRERVLAGVFLVLLAAALLGPSVAQPRITMTLPTTQLGLAAARDGRPQQPALCAVGHGGHLGAAAGRSVRGPSRPGGGHGRAVLRRPVVTAAVSAAYHLQPGDAGLVWDRGGMVLAFAGLLGLAAMVHSARAGMALATAVLVLGLFPCTPGR